MPFKIHTTVDPDPLAGQGDDEAGILKLLAYFDIFQYPLTKNEIRQFLVSKDTEEGLDKLLRGLVTRKTVFLHLGFYSLHNNPLLAHRRTAGNTRAEKMLPKAFTTGRFLFRFPFVRAIGISGSLSKNFADEKADIDFFIITKANRLWIARTIMHRFQKTYFHYGTSALFLHELLYR
jgi:hypothetical protein